MKNSLFLLATCAIPALGRLSLHERDVPAVVGFDIKRKDVSDPVARDVARRKRSETVSSALDNEYNLYLCNITLGSDKQALRLVIDTGSSDLWVNAPNSTFCEEYKEYCDYYGTYDATDSDTYSYVNSDFNISYADSSSAGGIYATDTVHIGDAEIKSLQFGIGYESSSEVGVLGIGYTTNEASESTTGESYANLPKAMVNKGLIQSNAYSLWLNDLDSNEGSILFGGIDTGKYHGELETLPILKTQGVYAAFYITLSGVSMTNSSGTSNYSSSSSLPAAVLLDSGSSLTYLPDAIVEDIYNELDVSYSSSAGYGYLPCSYAEKDYKFAYSFSGLTINVDMSELVMDMGGNEYYSNGDRACAFGIAPAGNTDAVLGDTFLRSAYVVYDLANNEISMANTNFNSTTSHISEIGTGADAVPSATGVANPETATSNPTAKHGSVPDSTDLPGTSSKNAAGPKPTQMPKHMALGLAGAALLVL
ncbi:hypothetical protein N7456_004236 [Penicillium angulare]|uniref:Probable aspartic-type endopeptidase OPSB n=1 Tax=Penicillium angulare TaxID=116970 RepID=A0A9W9FW51_9EURO|nr:hypothetical protein N7456_004236 [Penicillium angulare]